MTDTLPLWPIWAAYAVVLGTAVLFKGDIKVALLWGLVALAGTGGAWWYNRTQATSKRQ